MTTEAPTRQVHVTDHALERFRQRIAEFGDAKAEEVRRRVRECVVGNPFPLSVREEVGKEYLYHEGLGCVFICDPRPDGLSVVTVRKPECEVNYVTPKTKKDRLKRGPPKPEVVEDGEVLPEDPWQFLLESVPATVRSATERYAWWDAYHERASVLAALLGAEHPAKQLLEGRVGEARKAIKTLRPAYLTALVPDLVRRVTELEKEVGELRAAKTCPT